MSHPCKPFSCKASCADCHDGDKAFHCCSLVCILIMSWTSPQTAYTHHAVSSISMYHQCNPLFHTLAFASLCACLPLSTISNPKQIVLLLSVCLRYHSEAWLSMHMLPHACDYLCVSRYVSHGSGCTILAASDATASLS